MSLLRVKELESQLERRDQALVGNEKLIDEMQTKINEQQAEIESLKKRLKS